MSKDIEEALPPIGMTAEENEQLIKGVREMMEGNAEKRHSILDLFDIDSQSRDVDRIDWKEALSIEVDGVTLEHKLTNPRDRARLIEILQIAGERERAHVLAKTEMEKAVSFMDPLFLAHRVYRSPADTELTRELLQHSRKLLEEGPHENLTDPLEGAVHELDISGEEDHFVAEIVDGMMSTIGDVGLAKEYLLDASGEYMDLGLPDSLYGGIDGASLVGCAFRISDDFAHQLAFRYAESFCDFYYTSEVFGEQVISLITELHQLSDSTWLVQFLVRLFDEWLMGQNEYMFITTEEIEADEMNANSLRDKEWLLNLPEELHPHIPRFNVLEEEE